MLKATLRIQTFALLGLLSAVAIPHGLAAPPDEQAIGEALIQRGKRLYAIHCVGCHGAQGGGAGPAAYGLNPKPRDLTSGVFKFRSTPSGFLPTDSDLRRVIRQGVPGSSMPGFPLIPEPDVDALTLYLKTFSEKWQNPEAFASPIPVVEAPLDFERREEWLARAANGATLFTPLCSSCHGEEGKGDGPAGAALVDNWGHPAKPKNLSLPFVGGGYELYDVYRSLTTGLDGSPMVSYAASYSEEQRWDLVAFIHFLRERRVDPSLTLPNLANLPSSEEAVESEQEAATEDISIYE